MRQKLVPPSIKRCHHLPACQPPIPPSWTHESASENFLIPPTWGLLSDLCCRSEQHSLLLPRWTACWSPVNHPLPWAPSSEGRVWGLSVWVPSPATVLFLSSISETMSITNAQCQWPLLALLFPHLQMGERYFHPHSLPIHLLQTHGTVTGKSYFSFLETEIPQIWHTRINFYKVPAHTTWKVHQ